MPEEEVPKEPYVAIADRPGLLWKSVLAAAVVGAGIGLALGWDWALLCLAAAGAARRRAGGHRLAHPAAARPG